MITPNIWKNNPFMFQTTNLYHYWNFKATNSNFVRYPSPPALKSGKSTARKAKYKVGPASSKLVFINEGFQICGYPNSWMAYNGQSH